MGMLFQPTGVVLCRDVLRHFFWRRRVLYGLAFDLFYDFLRYCYGYPSGALLGYEQGHC